MAFVTYFIPSRAKLFIKELVALLQEDECVAPFLALCNNPITCLYFMHRHLAEYKEIIDLSALSIHVLQGCSVVRLAH
jgi:hypothetical protein